MGKKLSGDGVEGVDAKVETPPVKTKGNALQTTDNLPDGSIAYSRSGETEADDSRSLFDDETAPSDEDLQEFGESLKDEESIIGESTSEDTSGEEKAATTESGDDAKGDDAETKEASEEQEDAATKDEGRPVVPLSALQEERARRQALMDEVSNLKTRLSAIESGRASSKQTEEAESEQSEVDTVLEQFTKKVEEAMEGVEDDPIGSSKQTLNLLKEFAGLLKQREDGIKNEINKKEERRAENDTVSRVVNDGMKLMDELVPGIRDINGSDVNKNLTSFAREIGLPDTALATITHPGTIIKHPGGEPRYLGDDAAYIVSLINQAFNFSKKAKEGGTITEEAKKAMEKEIREKVTKEVLAKIKSGKGNELNTNIGELPGVANKDNDTDIFSGRPLTEQEYARLTGEEKERYLMS